MVHLIHQGDELLEVLSARKGTLGGGGINFKLKYEPAGGVTPPNSSKTELSPPEDQEIELGESI